ncbi:MAG TPA: hypothetical protein DEO49_02580 [Sutterella sp.]|nr:hypothetical protein [Sutterella sp.]
MAYKHWFVSRQKRQLTSILLALIAYSDVCVGQKWNPALQLRLEDALGERQITAHGSLRARKENAGGGGTRTLFKQMKDLGLVFLEDDTKKCRLTLIGEELVKGNVTFVDAMRLQLSRYQYPSAAVWSGTGSVDHSFKVHPFQFLFRLLRDDRLQNTLTMEEMSGIVIHHATDDSQGTLENVIGLILAFRNGGCGGFVPDTPTKTYHDIANTFFNYISLTQFTDRGQQTLHIRHGKEKDVEAFLGANTEFISNPQLTENYQRRFGRGFASRDLRNFNKDQLPSQKELDEARIRREYVLLALTTPITGITPDIVSAICSKTGIAEQTVERFLLSQYPHGNIDDFFVSYREFANMGRAFAREFEKATCEMFRKIFKMRAEHVGPIGNTPDVLILSESENFCGIIDNKAYHKGYSISGDHKRVMEDVYIPNYQAYGSTKLPLAFFAYIAGSFKKTVNSQLQEITRDTGISGSAMPVDVFINFAQDYANGSCTHRTIKDLFSLNREISLSDLP